MEGEGARRWVRGLQRTEDALLATMLAVMVLLACWQILARNLLQAGFPWADPLLRVLVLWVGLLGAMVASRENRHISVDVLSRILPERARAGAHAATHLFTAGVAALVAYHAGRFVGADLEAGVEAFAGVPAWVCEILLPLSLGLIALRHLLLCGAELRSLARGSGR